MTASQMYQRFLLKINESFSFNLFTWEAAEWLSQAQTELYRALTYYPSQKPQIDGRPQNEFQDSLYTAEALAPFQRSRGGSSDPSGKYQTDQLGFLAQPDDFDQLTSLLAFIDTSCSTSVPVPAVRDVELAQVLRNAFARPVWGDSTRIYPYAPIHTFETASGVPGWRIYPKRQYDVDLRYLTMPPEIYIKNTTFETANYSGALNFVSVLTDSDSKFPERWHEEIVTRGIRLFEKSLPDYNAEAAEARDIAKNQL